MWQEHFHIRFPLSPKPEPGPCLYCSGTLLLPPPHFPRLFVLLQTGDEVWLISVRPASKKQSLT